MFETFLIVFSYRKKKHYIEFGVFSLLADQESEQRGVELGFGRRVGLLPPPEDTLRNKASWSEVVSADLKERTPPLPSL